MTTIPLSVTGRAFASATGVAVVSLGPTRQGAKWTVEQMNVGSTSALASKLIVCRNNLNRASVVDSTSTGNDDVSDCNLTLLTLETLVFQWSGATPSAECYVTLYGTIDTGRRDA